MTYEEMYKSLYENQRTEIAKLKGEIDALTIRAAMADARADQKEKDCHRVMMRWGVVVVAQIVAVTLLGLLYLGR